MNETQEKPFGMAPEELADAAVAKDKRRFDEVGVRKALKYQIFPRNEWVLIKKMEREETVSDDGNIILPGGGRSQRGVVVGVAKLPWWKRWFGGGMPLKNGDIVVYTNFPIQLEDLEELTGEKNLELVRDEEVYSVARPCRMQ